MDAIRLEVPVTQTWLIFDPNQPITLCAYKSPKAIGKGITLSFSGYVRNYSGCPRQDSRYIEPYLLTIYHHIGTEAKIPSKSRIIDTSGNSMGSGLVAQPSFQEAISALREFAHYASIDGGTNAFLTITLIDDGIGLTRHQFYNSFTCIKFQKNLVHKQIDLHPYAFEGFRSSMESVPQQGFKSIYLNTGTKQITDELISSSDNELILYENEREYGWFIDSEYHDITKTGKNPFMVNDLGIANISKPHCISIPRGYFISHVFQRESIILYSATHKSPDRNQDAIFSCEQPMVIDQESFSYTLGKYRIPFSAENYLAKKKEETNNRKGGSYDYGEYLADQFIEAYHGLSEYFEDYFYVCRPLDNYLLGSIEQAEDKTAHALYLCLAWNHYFQFPFRGENLVSEVLAEASDTDETTPSYTRIVYKELCNSSYNIPDERAKLLYKHYETFLKQNTTQKVAKKIKAQDLCPEHDFPSFIYEHFFSNHEEDYLKDQIDLINKLLMSPE